MELERVDLGICGGYDYYSGRERTAIVLPGAMLGGMPVNAFVIAPLVNDGWRVVQVWDEYDASHDREEWARTRAQAAYDYAGGAQLVSGKSAGSLAAGFAAEHGLAGIWTTPLLHERAFVDELRRRTAPALLIGGTEDPMWDGTVARELGDEVLELPGADHGLARIADVTAVEQAVAAFSARLWARA
jgi:pimeloyl-ACP methyl ester carboxylesterase